MTQDTFEQRVLEMWVTTRVPLTRANVQFYTGAKRAQVNRWLDKLVGSGVLEVDADDDGEMIWAVRGAARSTSGPLSLEDAQQVARLRAEAKSTSLVKLGSSALASVSSLAGGGKRTGPGGIAAPGGQKSLIASGLLSFFFGPIGWLYAAPLKTAVPAILLYVLLCAVFPGFLLTPLLALANPISALAGVAYARRYNQNGERTPLLGGKDSDGPILPPRR